MPAQEKMSEILRQLTSIAKTTQVELDGLTPLAPAVGASAGEESVPMTVMATGHYFGVQRFLRLLRASADVHKGASSATDASTPSTASSSRVRRRAEWSAATMTINGFIYTAPPAGEAPAPPTTENTSATAVGQ